MDNILFHEITRRENARAWGGSLYLRAVALRRSAERGGALGGKQAAALTVTGQWNDGVAVAAAEGEIDIGTVAILTGRVGRLLRDDPRLLVIDLAGVAFIDSAGLAGFVRIRNALDPGCPMVLRSAQRRVRRVFKIAGLDQIFTFE